MARNDGDNQEHLLQHTVLFLEAIRAHPQYLADFRNLHRDDLIRRWPVLSSPIPPCRPLIPVSPEHWMAIWTKRLSASSFSQLGIEPDVNALFYDPSYCEVLEKAILGIAPSGKIPGNLGELFRHLSNPSLPLSHLWLKPVPFISQMALALWDMPTQRQKMLAADFLIPVYPWTTEADLAAAYHLGRVDVESSPTVKQVAHPGRKQRNHIHVEGPAMPAPEIMEQCNLRLSSVRPAYKHTRTLDTEQFEQQYLIYHLRRRGHTQEAAGRLIYALPKEHDPPKDDDERRARGRAGKSIIGKAYRASTSFWEKVRAMYDPYVLTWNWLAAQERGWKWSAPTIGLPINPPWQSGR